jgi:uncharacterized protein YjbI with pentapeptide repeats
MAGKIDFSRADLSREEQVALLTSSVKRWNAWREVHPEIRPDLRGAARTNLREADLRRANLSHANLTWVDLAGAHANWADLTGARLIGALLIDTSFVGATLDGCQVFGASVWNVRLDGARQENLCITDRSQNEPAITVNDLQVAQFIYLLLHNQEIGAVLDTIASKVVLIIGRFSDARNPALDALRVALRKHRNG